MNRAPRREPCLDAGRMIDAAHTVGHAHLPQWAEPVWPYTVIAWTGGGWVLREQVDYDRGPAWCGARLTVWFVPWPDDDPAPTCPQCVRRRAEAAEGGAL